MKIYTKTGDKGTTSLVGGERIAKTDLRVEAYGTVDELNSHVGWAAVSNDRADLVDALRAIQSDLLVMGSELATPEDHDSGAGASAPVRLSAKAAPRLEKLIDRFEAENEPLCTFILPGGSQGAAALHVCRSVCRRAERRVLALSNSVPVRGEVLRYLNRLSDLLFVAARWVNGRSGIGDVPWCREDPDGTGESSPAP